MEDKYIGIKPGGHNRFEPTNLGIIYERQPDGTYSSTNYKGRQINITEKELQHDLNLKYLKPIK